MAALLWQTDQPSLFQKSALGVKVEQDNSSQADKFKPGNNFEMEFWRKRFRAKDSRAHNLVNILESTVWVITLGQTFVVKES